MMDVKNPLTARGVFAPYANICGEGPFNLGLECKFLYVWKSRMFILASVSIMNVVGVSIS